MEWIQFYQSIFDSTAEIIPEFFIRCDSNVQSSDAINHFLEIVNILFIALEMTGVLCEACTAPIANK